jgi:hypothetical protein
LFSFFLAPSCSSCEQSHCQYYHSFCHTEDCRYPCISHETCQINWSSTLHSFVPLSIPSSSPAVISFNPTVIHWGKSSRLFINRWWIPLRPSRFVLSSLAVSLFILFPCLFSCFPFYLYI